MVGVLGENVWFELSYLGWRGDPRSDASDDNKPVKGSASKADWLILGYPCFGFENSRHRPRT